MPGPRPATRTLYSQSKADALKPLDVAGPRDVQLHNPNSLSAVFVVIWLRSY